MSALLVGDARDSGATSTGTAGTQFCTPGPSAVPGRLIAPGSTVPNVA